MKRLHVHVSVNDLAASARFYSTLFAAEPTVTKPDYVKWMLDDPRVNFAISTRSGKSGLDHFGIQVETKDELHEIMTGSKRPTGPCSTRVRPPAATPNRRSPGSPTRRACPGKPS